MRAAPIAAVLAAAFAVIAGSASAATPSQPLTTAIVDGFGETPQSLALDRAKETGSTAVIVHLSWAQIARRRPAHPRDPGDPAYDWHSFDHLVRGAAKRGLTVIARVLDTPQWAQVMRNPPYPNAGIPDAAAFGAFMVAAATRYSGTYHRLPRIRYWECWDEPNLTVYLQQLKGSKMIAPALYRKLLTRFASAVHGVRADNDVVAGLTAPFRDINRDVYKVTKRWGPLTFMRSLLCLSKSLRPTCNVRLHIDVWAHHPFTSGSPTHKALLPDDVSLGDLPRMRKTLNAAIRTGHIVSTRPVQFWADEISWDSNPPDPAGVPMELLQRWIPQMIYTCWRNGISLVAWLSLMDTPVTPTSFIQAGLWYNAPSFADAQPKPTLQAYRFPVVGMRRGTGIYVWGRTPWGRRDRVVVEQSTTGATWTRLGTLVAGSNGIFQGTFRRKATGSVRARLLSSGETSAAYGLKRVADLAVDPFGQVGCREKCHYGP